MKSFVGVLSVIAISWLSFSASASETGNEYLIRQNVEGMIAKPKEKPFYVSCKDLKQTLPDTKSGTYLIEPKGKGNGAYNLYCDMETDGGGWTAVLKQSNFEPQSSITFATNPWVLNDLTYGYKRSSNGNLSSLFPHSEVMAYSDSKNYFLMNTDFSGLTKTLCVNTSYRCTKISNILKSKVGLPTIGASTYFSFGYMNNKVSAIMMGNNAGEPWIAPVHGMYYGNYGKGNWVMMVR